MELVGQVHRVRVPAVLRVPFPVPPTFSKSCIREVIVGVSSGVELDIEGAVKGAVPDGEVVAACAEPGVPVEAVSSA